MTPLVLFKYHQIFNKMLSKKTLHKTLEKADFSIRMDLLGYIHFSKTTQASDLVTLRVLRNNILGIYKQVDLAIKNSICNNCQGCRALLKDGTCSYCWEEARMDSIQSECISISSIINHGE